MGSSRGNRSRGKALLLGLGRVGHVDQYDVTMGFEPRIRSELAGTDLKLELHRRVIAGHAALAHVGRTLGEGAYEREHSRPGGPTLPVSPCHDKSSTYASASSVCPPVNASLRSC